MVIISKLFAFLFLQNQGKEEKAGRMKEKKSCLAKVLKQRCKCIYGYNFSQISRCSNTMLLITT